MGVDFLDSLSICDENALARHSALLYTEAWALTIKNARSSS